MRAVRENIQPRSCCIDRAIARSIQQDRGWIFSRTARTVEISKFFIIWHNFVAKIDIHPFMRHCHAIEYATICARGSVANKSTTTQEVKFVLDIYNHKIKYK